MPTAPTVSPYVFGVATRGDRVEPDELALLGTMPDKNVAAKTGRGLSAVRAKRLQLGRPPRNPVWTPWTEEEIAFLGKLPDPEVARLTGHTLSSVSHPRWNMGIEYINPERRPWTAEEDKPAGDNR